jgi:hypothetical protein
MIGLMVAAPIFCRESKHTNAFRLVGVGLSIWMVVAVMLCAFSPTSWVLLALPVAFRVLAKLFVVLAAPFIGARPCKDPGCCCFCIDG